MSSLDKQIGGDHYKSMKIQAIDFVHANGMGFIEGCVIKYVSRWTRKGGIVDLQKARHYIDMLIELETKKANPVLNPFKTVVLAPPAVATGQAPSDTIIRGPTLSLGLMPDDWKPGAYGNDAT